MSYVVTRCDTNQHLWEIVKVPRLRKGHTKLKQFVEFGHVLKNATVGNDNLPPINTGQDFHGSHLFIMMCNLGLLPKKYRLQASFFKDCNYKPMGFIPMFVYHAMFYNGHFCSNSGCTKHLHKSWIDMLRSGIRFMKWFAFWVSPISGIPGGRKGDKTKIYKQRKNAKLGTFPNHSKPCQNHSKPTIPKSFQNLEAAIPKSFQTYPSKP